VRLSELFGDHDTLLAYSYMYGPRAARPCPMCTSFLDGLEGNASQLGKRVSLVVIARSPLARIREMARSRGWTKFRLLSAAGNTYAQDYRSENAEGAQSPLLHVFARRGGKIFHTYSTELLWAPEDPGQNGRHLDMMWPLWSALDLTPDGRGATWFPKLED
jgi:predicted dithiol-disulfide oxidoreductase (DUF899 family)